MGFTGCRHRWWRYRQEVHLRPRCLVGPERRGHSVPPPVLVCAWYCSWLWCVGARFGSWMPGRQPGLRFIWLALHRALCWRWWLRSLVVWGSMECNDGGALMSPVLQLWQLLDRYLEAWFVGSGPTLRVGRRPWYFCVAQVRIRAKAQCSGNARGCHCSPSSRARALGENY